MTLATGGNRFKLVLGYRVEQTIYEGKKSIVLRGVWEEKGIPVILKMLKQSYPSPEDVAWLKQEYKRTASFEFEGVARAYKLEQDKRRWFMVLEDFGGEALDTVLKGRGLDLKAFFPLSIKIAHILGQIHEQNVIHKNIAPSNIVLNQKTGIVKFIDFGIASELSQERPTFSKTVVLEREPAYLSPEQTGRMNRSVDYRTDLYSLGATFYELLCGHPPFGTKDLLELIHAHIAKEPVALCKLDDTIPKMLSEIVARLMAKNAEDRYQTAYGLEVDLMECFQRWSSNSEVKRFQLGKKDASDRFKVPQKLYGRERERQILLEAFLRVSKGKTEMLLVSGYSGIGKSALVQEVYKPITGQRGYFISGKFDQLGKTTPYGSLVQAFRSLAHHILTESEPEIASWREKLQNELGPNGQVIVDVIPEVELIIGVQPELPPLGLEEVHNRFNRVFRSFISVFCSQGHPLVLFLDDLQWSDGATLEFLKMLMTDIDSRYLFIIGAYRDNEVGGGHPLMLTLREIEQGGGQLSRVVLKPLALPNIAQLIAETVSSGPELVEELAELVEAKTGGNPFFINEFLQSLYEEELLSFERETRQWVWDIARVRACGLTDNVVDLMVQKVRRLAPRTQEALKLCACVGSDFDIRTAAMICEKPVRETALCLREGLKANLIYSLKESWRLMDLEVEGLAETLDIKFYFTHDRIRQAALSLIAHQERKAIHWKVGKLLLTKISPKERDSVIFDIVNQLDIGFPPDLSDEEREELAALNLSAAIKAKMSAAYTSAYFFAKTGLDLLKLNENPEYAWTRNYEMVLALCNEAAETAYFNGEYEEMERLIGAIRQGAKRDLDQVRSYLIEIKAYSACHRLLEGVRCGLKILKILGIEISERPKEQALALAWERTQSAWITMRIEDLAQLPSMEDARMLAVAKILATLYVPVYNGLPELFPFIVLKEVELSARFGNTPQSGRAYAAYGLILCDRGLISKGHRFGCLAQKLAELPASKEIKASTLFMINYFIRPWMEHLKNTVKPFIDAYRSGLETGDNEFAGISAFSYIGQGTWSGIDLKGLRREAEKYVLAVERLNQAPALLQITLAYQAILNLVGEAENPCVLIGDSFNEELLLPELIENNNMTVIFYLYTYKLFLCCLFGDFEAAVRHAEVGNRYIKVATSQIAVPVFRFYESLAYLAIYPRQDAAKQAWILKRTAKSLEQMKKWAEDAPMNFLHKFHLIKAERAAILDEKGNAREFYDMAIKGAQQHEYVNEEALANELAFHFYRKRKMERFASLYLKEARYLYESWGAVPKVKQLTERYGSVAETTYQSIPSRKAPAFSIAAVDPGSDVSQILDLASVLKVSQAISGEIVRDKLLSRLMEILFENAGAQKGVLLLERHGGWFVEAAGEVDVKVGVLQPAVPLEEYSSLCTSVICYVIKTKKKVVLNGLSHDREFLFRKTAVREPLPKSLLCLPILQGGELCAIVYLENNLCKGAFPKERLMLLQLLSSQMAISIENATLYSNMEHKVAERTVELRQTLEELEQKHAQLKEAQTQLVHAEKMASLGLLTAGVAHEINNPINFVHSGAQNIEHDLHEFKELLQQLEGGGDEALDEEDQEMLRFFYNKLNQLSSHARLVLDGTNRVRHIVRDLKTFTRFEEADFKTVQLSEDLRSTVGLICARYQDTAKIIYNFQSNPTVECLPAQLNQVFVNLTVNAYQAIQRKHQENPDAQPGVIEIGIETLNGWAIVRFRDNGNGIPEEIKHKIFEPFFTTHEVGGGSGLGLPTAYGIIQQHKGRIDVESVEGAGSTFTVRLPIERSWGGSANSPRS